MAAIATKAAIPRHPNPAMIQIAACTPRLSCSSEKMKGAIADETSRTELIQPLREP